MEVDTEQLRRDGYLLLRNVVPPAKLADMRLTAELMVDGAKRNSAATGRRAICSAQITCSGLIEYGYGDWHRPATP